MNTLFRLSILGLALGAATLSFAQITVKGGRYDFRVALRPGLVINYEFVTSLSGLGKGKPIVETMTSMVKVLSKSGPNHKVQILSSGGAFAKPQDSTVILDSRGNAISGKSVANTGIMVPPKPIRIGETWKSLGGLGGPLQTTKGITEVQGDAVTIYKFEGIRTVKGQKVALIKIRSSVVGSLKIDVMGTAYVSVKDGMLVGSGMTATIPDPTANSAKSPPLKMVVSVRRTSAK